MRLWVTRTQPGADRTARTLEQAGHTAIIQPVLEHRALPGAQVDLTDATALAFTSRNAVDVFRELSDRRDLAVFTPGDGTAQAARDIGFATVTPANGAVAELAELIGRHCQGGLVVWPGPVEPAGDLVALLSALNITAHYQPIYETSAAEGAAPFGIDGVLIHSPKGAAVVASLLSPEAARGLAVFAISPAAAAPLAHLPFIRVSVAPLPSETALVNLIEG